MTDPAPERLPRTRAPASGGRTVQGSRWPRRILLGLAIAAGAAALFVAGFILYTRYGHGPGAPNIGLSVSNEWYDRLQLHRAPYDLAIARAGANVTTIEPQALDKLDRILDEVDAVVLAGGGDVDPDLFGGEPSKAYAVNRARDVFEIELLRRAEKRGLPVVAICRGIQILCVWDGGKLRNLEGDKELADRHGVTIRSFQAHQVRITPGTRLHGILGPGPHTVTSFHIQAVDDPGKRLRVAATGPQGVVEAVEMPGERMVIGIQWHPEVQAVAEDLQQKLFEALIEEAKRRKHGANISR